MLHFQRWKLILVAVVVVAGFLYALPNLFSGATVARIPTWLPHKQVNLGLDLQGGARRCGAPASAIPIWPRTSPSARCR